MKPSNKILVGVDGELHLYASPEGDSETRTGVLYNTRLDTVSIERPLQVFFKWGNFVTPEDVEKKHPVGVIKVKGG